MRCFMPYLLHLILLVQNSLSVERPTIYVCLNVYLGEQVQISRGCPAFLFPFKDKSLHSPNPSTPLNKKDEQAQRFHRHLSGFLYQGVAERLETDCHHVISQNGLLRLLTSSAFLFFPSFASSPHIPSILPTALHPLPPQPAILKRKVAEGGISEPQGDNSCAT